MARIDGSGDIFLTGYCKAEMKTRERYHIKMRLAASGFSSDGKIDDLKFASCQCKARYGPTASCKHIAAFCFGLDDFTRRGVFEGVTSCTSDLQRWNAPPAKRQCSEITFTAALLDCCSPSQVISRHTQFCLLTTSVNNNNNNQCMRSVEAT